MKNKNIEPKNPKFQKNEGGNEERTTYLVIR